METWLKRLDLLDSPRKLLLLHGSLPLLVVTHKREMVLRNSLLKDAHSGLDTMENDCWKQFSSTDSQMRQCRSWTCSRTAATTGALPATSRTMLTILYTPPLPLLRSDTDVILLQHCHRSPLIIDPLLFQVYTGLGFFLLCELGNFACHLLFR